jgi:hypothetical protein
LNPNQKRLKTLTAAHDAVVRLQSTMNLDAPCAIELICEALTELDPRVVQERQLEEWVETLKKACARKWCKPAQQTLPSEKLQKQIRSVASGLRHVREAFYAAIHPFTVRRVRDTLDTLFTEACRRSPEISIELPQLADPVALHVLKLLVQEEDRHTNDEHWNALVHEVIEFFMEARLGAYTRLEPHFGDAKRMARKEASNLVHEELTRLRRLRAPKRERAPQPAPPIRRSTIIELAPNSVRGHKATGKPGRESADVRGDIPQQIWKRFPQLRALIAPN